MKFSQNFQDILEIVSNSPKNYVKTIWKLGTYLYKILIRNMWNSSKNSSKSPKNWVNFFLSWVKFSWKLRESFLKNEWKWNFFKNWMKFS